MSSWALEGRDCCGVARRDVEAKQSGVEKYRAKNKSTDGLPSSYGERFGVLFVGVKRLFERRVLDASVSSRQHHLFAVANRSG